MMQNQTDSALFNDSLERSQRNGLFERFYQHFVSSSPEIAVRFRNTDMEKQERVLKSSLYLMMLAQQNMPEGSHHMQLLARRHSQHELDIRPELYDIWLNCLLDAVRESDPQFSPQVEEAWRAMLRPGIAYMQQHYTDQAAS